VVRESGKNPKLGMVGGVLEADPVVLGPIFEAVARVAAVPSACSAEVLVEVSSTSRRARVLGQAWLSGWLVSLVVVTFIVGVYSERVTARRSTSSPRVVTARRPGSCRYRAPADRWASPAMSNLSMGYMPSMWKSRR
jgi:hypothetical protein